MAHALPRSSNTLLHFLPKLKTSLYTPLRPSPPSTILLSSLVAAFSPLFILNRIHRDQLYYLQRFPCNRLLPRPRCGLSPPIHFSEQEAELLSTAQPWRKRVRQARTQIHPIIPITSLPRSSRATSTRNTMLRRLAISPLRMTRKTRTWTH
jgi:hypothetical protein